MAAGGFRLTKWYLDCVDRDRVAVVYWSAVSWGEVSLVWSQVTTYEPGREPRRDSSLARIAEPRREGERLGWSATQVGARVGIDVARSAPAVRLLDSPSGALDWEGVATAARARIDVAGQAPFVGTGYAERLVLTLPPWQLPIRELRWGRWIADDAARSLVWIDWRGSAPGTWILLDGALLPGALVGDMRISCGVASLEVEPVRSLHRRRLSDVLDGIAPLRALVPARFLGLSDERWLGRGVLTLVDGARVSGSTIHEAAVFA